METGFIETGKSMRSCHLASRSRSGAISDSSFIDSILMRTLASAPSMPGWARPCAVSMSEPNLAGASRPARAAVPQRRGGFGHFERHFGGRAQGLLHERSAFIFGPFVGRAHGVIGCRIALHRFGEELAIRFESIRRQLGQSRNHRSQRRRHGCRRRGRAAPPGRGRGRRKFVEKFVQSIQAAPSASARRFSNTRLGWKFSTCKYHSAVISSARLGIRPTISLPTMDAP